MNQVTPGRTRVLLKKENPLPPGFYLPAGMEVGIDRENTCPNWEEMSAYEQEHPYWGMPYALPGLSPKEDKALRAWLDAGAPTLTPSPLPQPVQQEIASIEAWLNDARPGRNTAAKYIYEHLFLASLYLDSQSERPEHWFRLIRSSTPPGQAPSEIATRLPIDPVQGGVFYRLMPRDETVLSKTHLTYSIGRQRIQRWETLFDDSKIAKSLEAAGTSDARSNPFRTFAGISMESRYRFLLDDAEFFLGGFIKGPVCRGQTALNVIQDRFWVVFLNPDSQVSDSMNAFLRDVHDDLILPAEDGSQSSLVRWFEYAMQHERYLEKKRIFIEKQSRKSKGNISTLWEGKGRNPNAALTVFRHHDSATVVKGLVGPTPKTAWLLSYPELERIHYLLVAGFDVFGNIGHQVNTRLYMDFLRMEGEYNFSLLMEKSERIRQVESWYRDLGGLKQYWLANHLEKSRPTGVWEQEGIRRLPQVYTKIKQLLAPIDRAARWNLPPTSQDAVLTQLAQLGQLPAQSATHFPEMTLILVTGKRPRLFTMLRESAFANVARLLLDKERRRPGEDKLLVLQGVLGSYPNAIVRIREDQVSDFVAAVRQTKSESDYARYLSRFGVRRTNKDFWSVSDQIHDIYAKLNPREYGRLDYNRLENR